MSISQPPRDARPEGPGTSEKLAIGAAVCWLLLGGLAWWFVPGSLGLAGVGIPLILLAATYAQARQLRVMRHETARLRETLDRMQDEKAAAGQRRGDGFESGLAAAPGIGPEPFVPPHPRDIAPAPTAPAPTAPAAPRDEGAGHVAATVPRFRSRLGAEPDRTAAATPPPEQQDRPADKPVTFATRRDTASARMPLPPDGGTQWQLALGPEHDARPPLPVRDFVTALNFPQTPEDTDGFRALRLALRHPPTAPMIQASQDVLTLMSQIGLYMDDLVPEHIRPDLWRRFAEGERGGVIGGLGGIHDTDALLTCANQMRDDLVFRDATHHFLRRFDQLLAARIEELSDTDLIRMADTRTARAFMLLGRAAGIFD